MTDATTRAAESEALAKAKNCLTCHGIKQKIVGPAFSDVAAKYKGDETAADRLINAVKNGSSGNWGAIPMPPNLGVSDAETKTLVEWVLSLDGS
jgi:cytochrome c551/c552